jgi:hypothetical protein
MALALALAMALALALAMALALALALVLALAMAMALALDLALALALALAMADNLDDLLELELEFQFEVEEDDFKGEVSSETATPAGVGDWVKPVDTYHRRASDIGQISQIRGYNVSVAWVSDGTTTSIFIDEIVPIPPPTALEAQSCISNAVPPMPSACPDRIDPNPSKVFRGGDLVMARSVMSRWGVQLGVITETLPDNKYTVDWHHVIGVRPKDSKSSHQKPIWCRSELMSAAAGMALPAKSKALKSASSNK